LPPEEALAARRTGYTPDTEALWHFHGSLSPKEVLKVAVLGENVSQRLVHDFIGGGVEKGCVLVDLLGGRFVKADGSGNLTGLNDLKQRHFQAPFGECVGVGLWWDSPP
jgi:hypothetical protein